MQKIFVYIICLCSGLITGTGSCAQPFKQLNSYYYNVNDGLLHSQVNDLTEDKAGFIWISTSNGLQRFDGKTFHTIENKGIADDNAGNKYIQLFRLKNGNILLNYRKSIIEYNSTGNQFQVVMDFIPDNSNSYKAIAEEDNAVWYLFPGKGYFKLDRVAKRFVDSIKTPLLLETTAKTAPVNMIYTGRYFVLLILRALIITDRLSGKTWIAKMNEPSPVGYFSIEKYKPDSVLAATGKGIVLLDCITGRVRNLNPYRNNPMAINPSNPVQLKQIEKNLFLVSEGNQLFELRLPDGRYTTKLVNLFNKEFTSIGYISRMYFDSHSNLWLLSENDGIRKINYQIPGFGYYGTENRNNNFIKSIYVNKPDNRVLCGTFGEGLLVFDTAHHLLKQIRSFPGISPPYTVCAFWKTAPHRYILLLMGKWEAFELNTENFTLSRTELITNNIRKQIDQHFLPDYHLSLYPLNDSSSILQSGFNLYRIHRVSSYSLNIYPINSFSAASITSYLDQQGRLWVGSYGKYFLSVSGYSQFREITLPENKMVRCFYPAGSGNMWMGTETGLYLLNSSGEIIQTFKKADGLADENIYALRQDREGHLWMSHNKGISCRRKDGSFYHYSKNDGLQENEFNTNTSFETPDGELYFGGVNGVSSFYPETIMRNRETPQVVLVGIKIKDAALLTDTASWQLKKLVLPYYKNSIQFELSAIGSRSSDQYNYQYQLSGIDNEWVNAGKNTQIRYVLQPGKYSFRYYAGNAFEKNPNHYGEINITIKAPYWKTAWFISIIVLLIAAFTIGITRQLSQIKLKKRIGYLEKKRMIDNERLRIAREMHDDIGAGLTQISLLSERAKKMDPNQKQLDEIAETSRKLTESMSEIIWSLKSENNSLQELLAYLREQLHKLLEYSDIQYQINFAEQVPDIQLNNAQRRNLLLVTKEIVHNAVKHSGANEIMVQYTAEPDRLLFRITDNGKGFDLSDKTNGNGLRNIRRRIEELNGTIQIRSASGQGCSISYTIPV